MPRFCWTRIGGCDMAATSKTSLVGKVKFALIGLLVGLLCGVIGVVLVQNYAPSSNDKDLTASVVFDRIVSKNELVGAFQNYNIVEKVMDTNTFFDLFEIPFTQNSFWYRYNGTIKAGVDLSTATYQQAASTITIELDQPYILSNTPDMEVSGVLEENNNILNPIHVEDVDAFQRLCVELSEANALEGGLMEETRENVEQDIRDMFNAALGGSYSVEFVWRQSDEG